MGGDSVPDQPHWQLLLGNHALVLEYVGSRWFCVIMGAGISHTMAVAVCLWLIVSLVAFIWPRLYHEKRGLIDPQYAKISAQYNALTNKAVASVCFVDASGCVRLHSANQTDRRSIASLCLAMVGCTDTTKHPQPLEAGLK
jgi:hypothetical protein